VLLHFVTKVQRLGGACCNCW